MTPEALRKNLGWNRGALLLAVTLACAPPDAPALDRIVTRDGRMLDGEIIARDFQGSSSETVTIQLGATKIALPIDQIESITQATPEQGALSEARQALKRGDVGEGVFRLDDAIRMSMDPREAAGGAAALVLIYGNELAREIPEFNADQSSATSRVLAALGNVREAPAGRGDDLLARRIQLHLLLGEAPAAQRLLEQGGSAMFARNELLRRRFGEWMTASIAPLIEESDYGRVIPVLETLGQVDDGFAGGKLTQIYLQWAWNERQQGNFAEALEIYIGHVLDDSPEIARDRITVALEEAERTARERDELPAAAGLYERYGLPHVADFARQRLVQIWRDQGWRFLRRREFPAARDAFDRAETIQPGSAKKDLLQLEFRNRRGEIPDDDSIGRYQLGVWALQQELMDEALVEFQAAEADPTVGPNATAYVGQILNKRAEQELIELFRLYEEGEFGRVLGGLHQFMQQPYPVGFLKQAKQLEDLTNDALKLRVAERPQQAEAMFQRAQRAYFSGDYAEAESLLRTLAERYGDTVVHARAMNFYSAVRQKLMLASLEQGQAMHADALTTDTATTLTQTGDELERLKEKLEKMNYQ